MIKMLKLSLLLCFTLNVLVDSFPFDESVIESHANGINKIDITQVPHQVALFAYDLYSCSGIILSPTHIVTSAYCVFLVEIPQIVVRAGSTFNRKGGVLSKVKSVHIHHRYDHYTSDYDVAVVELATPLKFDNKTVKAAKFASKEPPVGSNVTVAGWGYYKNDSDEDNRLKSVTIPIQNRTFCENALKEYERFFTKRMMCGSVDRKMGFAGDVGSAALYNGEVVGFGTVDFLYEKEHAPRVFTNYANPEIFKFVLNIVDE